MRHASNNSKETKQITWLPQVLSSRLGVFFLASFQKAAANEARQRASARAAGTYRARAKGGYATGATRRPAARRAEHTLSERASERRSLAAEERGDQRRRARSANALDRAESQSRIAKCSKGVRRGSILVQCIELQRIELLYCGLLVVEP
jgi:hypothetical protein